MNKTYQPIQEEPVTAAEPVAVYGVRSTFAAPKKNVTSSEGLMASTVSIDEYFDELIDLVRKDYANLWS